MTRGQHGRPVRRASISRILTTLLAVACLLGAALGIWWIARDDGVDPGTYVAPNEITSSSPTSLSPTDSSSPSSASSGTSSSPTYSKDDGISPTPDESTSSSKPSATAEGADAGSAPAGDPARVQVLSGGRELVNASLQATYLDAQKVLAPPYGTAGWYAEPGWPKPGHRGASILVGHIDHRGQPDVFWNLPQVRAGDTVKVTYGSGKVVTFRITRSEAAGKTQVPTDDSIWDHDNLRPVLRLITCDPTTPLDGGHYQGNWVVWAEPA